MHAPTWPSLSSGDVDTACLSTHIITPPDINLILTSRPKKSFSEFFREVQSVFTSIASGSLGHRNQTVLFFACRMFQLDNFWQFRHREIQSGIHAPPVNLRPTFRAVYHPHINLLPPHIYNQSSQLSLPLSRMTEPRSSCPPLLSTVHRLNKSDERVPSSCFSSAVYPAAAVAYFQRS
jgi:hypothetical protein